MSRAAAGRSIDPTARPPLWGRCFLGLCVGSGNVLSGFVIHTVFSTVVSGFVIHTVFSGGAGPFCTSLYAITNIETKVATSKIVNSILTVLLS